MLGLMRSPLTWLAFAPKKNVFLPSKTFPVFSISVSLTATSLSPRRSAAFRMPSAIIISASASPFARMRCESAPACASIMVALERPLAQISACSASAAAHPRLGVGRVPGARLRHALAVRVAHLADEGGQGGEGLLQDVLPQLVNVLSTDGLPVGVHR